MIKAITDKGFKQIRVFIGKKDVMLLIHSFDEALEVFRKKARDGLMPVLEIMETLRFKINCALYTDENDGENAEIQPQYSFMLSPVRIFYYTQLLNKAFDDDLNSSDELPREHRERLALFISEINDPISETIDDNELERIKYESQYNVSFLYIQYLNFLYEDKVQTSDFEENIKLFISLCGDTQRSRSNDSILPHDVFAQRCDLWMRKHNTDYICLDEIIADESFRQL